MIQCYGSSDKDAGSRFTPRCSRGASQVFVPPLGHQVITLGDFLDHLGFISEVLTYPGGYFFDGDPSEGDGWGEMDGGRNVVRDEVLGWSGLEASTVVSLPPVRCLARHRWCGI